MAKVVIIAEAGVNHNGDIELAKKLVDAAADAKADYVKFQTFKAEKLVASSAQKADYQKKNTGNAEESQLQMLKKLELSKEDHQTLIKYCNKKRINFFSTAFDLDSLQYLAELGLDLVKVPSGEIINLPYLERAAQLFRKIIISTGMATMQEIKDAVHVFIRAGISKNDITVLHCNTEYPTPMADVNLRAMNQIGQELGVAIGYSDHTLGIEVPVAAVALGASVIEKHFTLDRNLEGPDHKASLEPIELMQMVQSIRNIELALGDGVKKPSLSEEKNKVVARKSIVAARHLEAGHIIQHTDITTKRPGSGISPMDIGAVVGKRLKKSLHQDEVLMYEYLSE